MDPLTVIAAATTAFNTVKKFVDHGREVEEVVGHLGKWFTAVSDFKELEKESSKPPLFKKILASGSVEEEALLFVVNKRKIEQQEKELRELITYYYGLDTLREMYDMRRKIREQREKAIYEQRRRRKKFFELIASALLIVVGISIIAWLVIFLVTYK